MNEREEKLRKYMIRAYSKDQEEPTEIDTNSASGTDAENLKKAPKKAASPQQLVKVLDRFGIILQIFAQRACSRESSIQLELAWLNNIKHRLVRDKELGTMATVGNFMKGNAVL